MENRPESTVCLEERGAFAQDFKVEDGSGKCKPFLFNTLELKFKFIVLPPGIGNKLVGFFILAVLQELRPYTDLPYKNAR